MHLLSEHTTSTHQLKLAWTKVAIILSQAEPIHIHPCILTNDEYLLQNRENHFVLWEIQGSMKKNTSKTHNGHS